MSEKSTAVEYTNKIYEQMCVQAQTHERSDILLQKLWEFQHHIRSQVLSVLHQSKTVLGELQGDVQVTMNNWSNTYGLVSFSFGTKNMYQNLDTLGYYQAPTIGIWDKDLFTGDDGVYGNFEVPISEQGPEYVEVGTSFGLEEEVFSINAFGTRSAVTDVLDEPCGTRGIHRCEFLKPDSPKAKHYAGKSHGTFALLHSN